MSLIDGDNLQREIDTLGIAAAVDHLMRFYVQMKINVEMTQAKLDACATPDDSLRAELAQWVNLRDRAEAKAVEINLPLVKAWIKRAIAPRDIRDQYDELFSVGSWALLRSVRCFDVNFGYRFSTYASRSIFTALSRMMGKVQRRRDREFNVTVELQEVIEGRPCHEAEQWARQEAATEVARIVLDNECELEERERDVLLMRFGVGDGVRGQSMMLQQIGNQYGIMKERVRQIQNKALAKVRAEFEVRSN